MGFFDKLKKVLPYVEKGAVIARQAEGNPVGAALATVELIAEGDVPAGTTSAPLSTVRAVAVAVDDLEARLVAVEKALKAAAPAKKKAGKK